MEKRPELGSAEGIYAIPGAVIEDVALPAERHSQSLIVRRQGGSECSIARGSRSIEVDVLRGYLNL